jgi:putative ABC transport system permease protein
MSAYFWKALRHHVGGGKSLYLLTVCGVALGVASVLCIQILNQNALAAFSGSVKAVSGDADLSIVGGTPTLDEVFYPRVLGTAGVAAAWPLYRVYVNVAGYDDLFLEIVGADFFAPVSFPVIAAERDRDRKAGGASRVEIGGSIADVLVQPGWVAISPRLAAEMGWRPGDPLRVSSGSRVAELRIGALVDFHRYIPLASRKLALMDIAQAQGLLGHPGRIHQIDVMMSPGVDVETLRERLARRLGPNVQILTPSQREQQAAGLLAAFRLNLSALSLISLFVGMFLITSSVQAALVRRRTEFGLLRSLGATSRQVLGIILAEVVLLGGLGTAVGIPVGYWTAVANVKVVSGTLTNIYLLNEIEQLRLGWELYVTAIVIGVGGAMLGALLPALDMSRRDTHSLMAAFTLHERTSRWAPRLARLAIVVALLSALWYWKFGTAMQWGGFVLGFALLLGLPLLTPWFIRFFCGRVPAQGLNLAYSLKNLAVRAQTTSLALAALATAVSMLIGVTLMIGSFRQTLIVWLDETIRADIYVTTESWTRAGQEAFLTPEVIEAVTSHPQVAATEKLRQFRLQVGERRIKFSGLDMNLAARGHRMPLLAGEPCEVVRRLREEGAVLISEPLARKERLAVGDTLTIMGPDVPVGLPVAGISHDYSSEGGGAFVDLATLERIFGPGPIQNMMLYLREGAAADDVVAELRARTAGVPLEIRSNGQVRIEILRIFDQTFAITRILQAMALLIAVCGIALTLIILARQRVAELALYRSLGALRRQIFKIFLGEGLGLGLLGLVMGTAGGIGLAIILIYVINRAYFGCTIQASWPWRDIVQQMVTILLAAVAASVYPALRASRTPARELSREDV